MNGLNTNFHQDDEKNRHFAEELGRVFFAIGEDFGVTNSDAKVFFLGEQNGKRSFYGFGTGALRDGFTVAIENAMAKLIAMYYPGSARREVFFNFRNFENSSFGRFTYEFAIN